jgi:hypothetical protein
VGGCGENTSDSGSFEHSNELSCSIKGKQFCDQLRKYPNISRTLLHGVVFFILHLHQDLSLLFSTF